MSIAGSSCRSSTRTNTTSIAMPSASRIHTTGEPAPFSRRNVSALVRRSRARVRMTNPHVSSRRPRTGSDSGTATAMTTHVRVTAIAGMVRVSARSPPVAAKMRPAASAPMIAPAWSPTTRSPAARRVNETPRFCRRPRSKMRAISSGSHTT